jgi:hypothetical protein
MTRKCQLPSVLQNLAHPTVLTFDPLPMHSPVLLHHLLRRPAAAAAGIDAKQRGRQGWQVVAQLLQLSI